MAHIEHVVASNNKSMAVVAHVDRALGLVEVGALAPLRPAPPPEKVLDEDKYVEALESIITRDYFPDLPSLRQEEARLDVRLALSITPTCSSPIG